MPVINISTVKSEVGKNFFFFFPPATSILLPVVFKGLLLSGILHCH